MTRIQFTSPTNYTAVVEPLAQNQDKGIESHNAVWAFFQNLASIFKICSPIFAYKIDDNTTLYLNVASFNNWLGRHNITKLASSSDSNEEIANLMREALGIPLQQKAPDQGTGAGGQPVDPSANGDPANKTAGADVF